MNEYTHLQGRVIALELMMRGFMTELAMRDADPVEFIRGWRESMFSSLQHLGRPIDEGSDEIWSEAIEALNRLFDEVTKRIQNLPS